MATIKSYTDLEQSRKLAEILPIESADMRYDEYTSHIDGTPKVGYKKGVTDGIPCWSLVALLNVASTYCNRLEITLRTNKKYNVFAVKGDFVFRSFDEFSDGIDNIIDCCYELILKLKELNLL